MKGILVTDSMWGYPAASGHQAGVDLRGFKVEAVDGGIGKVDKHSDEVGSAFVVVDTGVWIFGKHVLLPAGTISTIDATARTIFVSRTKDEIKGAPEFYRDQHTADLGYHQQVGGYYGQPRG